VDGDTTTLAAALLALAAVAGLIVPVELSPDSEGLRAAAATTT
jgi:hypothetical protein